MIIGGIPIETRRYYSLAGKILFAVEDLYVKCEELSFSTPGIHLTGPSNTFAVFGKDILVEKRIYVSPKPFPSF